MTLPREPVTIAQLAERLGIELPSRERETPLTRKAVHRLARAAWQAKRRGLLILSETPPLDETR